MYMYLEFTFDLNSKLHHLPIYTEIRKLKKKIKKKDLLSSILNII